MAAFAQSLLLVLSQSPQTISRFRPSLVASRPTRQPTLQPSLHMVMVRCKFGRPQMCLGPAQTLLQTYLESQNHHWKRTRPTGDSYMNRYLQIRLRTMLRLLSLHQLRTGRERVLLSQRDLEKILKIMITRYLSRPQIQHPSDVRPQLLCRRHQHLSPLPSRVSNMTLLLPSIRAPIRQPESGTYSREGIT